MGRPPVPRGPVPHPTVGRRAGRPAVGRAKPARPRGSGHRLEPGRADPGDLHGKAGSAGHPVGLGRRKLHATTVALEPLSPEEAERLVDNLVGGVDGSARARIVAAAEGNPLFAEETVAMLVDDGVIRREGDRWVAADLERVSVPPTIQALLAARLDRLDDAERALLGRAAVVGQVFYLGAIRELGPEGERNDTGRLVQQLVRRDLVRPPRPTWLVRRPSGSTMGYSRTPRTRCSPKRNAPCCTSASPTGSRPARAWPTPTSSSGSTSSRRTGTGASSVPTTSDRTTSPARGRAAVGSGVAGDRAQRHGRDREPVAPRRGAPRTRRSTAGMGSHGARLESWATRIARRRWPRPSTKRSRSPKTTGDERAIAHASLGATFGRWLVAPEGGSDAIAALLDQVLPQLEAWANDRGVGDRVRVPFADPLERLPLRASPAGLCSRRSPTPTRPATEPSSGSPS